MIYITGDMHNTIDMSNISTNKLKAKEWLRPCKKTASTRWTMPIKDWALAVNQFAILFDGRVPVFN